MQQRAKNNRSLREANRLLQMRDTLRAKLGDAYAEATGVYTPFVAQELKRCACPQTAALRVLKKLETQQQSDIAVARLVICAALDLALEAAA